ncbi:expressed unknown protein [Seminavis robusta]|uniref:Uncharacterized protein n=1 Tax=Seminavis robusta TaxID=568900 RepID=A0A9N8HTN3_9STRA|nr:expressed unknown protein [Seminavis robusta]|eukprot:Sro1686_g291120.1 n/a (263) ;mRNA; r:5398-6186
MMDRNASNQGEPDSVKQAEKEQRKDAELKNFGSDHALDGRQPELPYARPTSEDNSDIPMVAAARRPSARNSIFWGDLITPAAGGRRGSVPGSSVSSLTISDLGDSFFSESFMGYSQQFGTVVEDEEALFDSSGSDHKPVCPKRRDSISSQKIHSTRFMLSHNNHNDVGTTGKRLDLSPVRRPGSEMPPVKPGRRESISKTKLMSRSRLLDRNAMYPTRQDSASTVSDQTTTDSSSKGDDSTLTSAHSPCLLRSDGKRKLFSG